MQEKQSRLLVNVREYGMNARKSQERQDTLATNGVSEERIQDLEAQAVGVEGIERDVEDANRKKLAIADEYTAKKQMVTSTFAELRDIGRRRTKGDRSVYRTLGFPGPIAKSLPNLEEQIKQFVANARKPEAMALLAGRITEAQLAELEADITRLIELDAEQRYWTGEVTRLVAARNAAAGQLDQDYRDVVALTKVAFRKTPAVLREFNIGPRRSQRKTTASAETAAENAATVDAATVDAATGKATTADAPPTAEPTATAE